MALPSTAENMPNDSAVVSFSRNGSMTRVRGAIDRRDSVMLLVGEIADSFLLAFRSLARSARLPYSSLRCRVEGTGDLSGPSAGLTDIRMAASVVVSQPSFEADAFRLLEKARTLASTVTAETTLLSELEVLVGPAARASYTPLALTRQAG
jgi:hypothetical protein